MKFLLHFQQDLQQNASSIQSGKWSSGQGSWLQVQRYRFDSRRYQIFWEAVDLERGPLSLVSTTEELLGRKSSGFGLESREYCRGYQMRWPRDTLYMQKLALTSMTRAGRSAGIVRSRTKDTVFLMNDLTYQIPWVNGDHYKTVSTFNMSVKLTQFNVLLVLPSSWAILTAPKRPSSCSQYTSAFSLPSTQLHHSAEECDWASCIFCNQQGK
jgi:hypothetical protein